jgi:lysophospholipase L1-like esterase
MQLLIIGSSIFQQWSSAALAFPGANTQNCAVGGTTTDYWVSCINDTLTQHKSDLVAYYCGSNDFNQGISEDTIIRNTLQTFAKVKEAQRTFIYYTIIKSPQKRGQFQAIDRVNQALTQAIGKTDHIVDLNECLCEEMTDISNLYQDDLLHLTPTAYQKVEAYNRTTFWNALIQHA